MSLLADIDWSRVLQSESDTVALLGFMALLAILGTAAIIGLYWQKTLRARLKERMIERGFTAEEIISVINAGEGRDQGRKAATQVNDRTSQPDRQKNPAG